MIDSLKIESDNLKANGRILSYREAISLLSSLTHIGIYKTYKPTAVFFQKNEFDSYFNPVFEETLIIFLTQFMGVPDRATSKLILEASITTKDYEIIYANVLLSTIGKIAECGGICN